MTRILFSLTLFLAAALLFSIQLLTSKMLLPILGGSASVWNTCLVFFQLALLLGYLYAHGASRWLPHRTVMLAHPALLIVAALTLPVAVAGLAPPPSDASPVPWLLGTLLVTVGPPFIILSATAPLLQDWFSRSGDRAARDPYFLYAASNLGSLIGLVTYPSIVEPHLRLAEQSRWWADGYGLLVLLTAACAVAILAPRRPRDRDLEIGASAPPSVPGGDWLRRLRWVLLAFVPSSLLLGVTSHLTTDVAAAPLFWVVPLTLYLLSFVLAFQRLWPIPDTATRPLQALLMVALAVMLLTDQSGEPIPLFAVHLAAFFMTALLCHQELARLRPPVRRLTEFYLLVSVGGALGGVFNALVAPLVFSSVVEYPLVLVLACLVRPGALPRIGQPWPAVGDVVLPALLLGLILWLQRDTPLDLTDLSSTATALVAVLAALAVFAAQSRPVRFGLGIAALVGGGAIIADSDPVLLRVRNFYGVVKVIEQEPPAMHVLMHGTTTHGAQDLDAADRLKPLSYYHHDGPLGQLFEAVGGTRLTRRVAVVGLGAGTIACYAHPGEQWTFFEINPAVVAIARDRALFTFLGDCPAHPDIVLGDARLSLAAQPAASFDMIILDAFTSDAIPIHLMTRDAVRLYLDRLRPDGLLVFHISNRYLALAPVLGDIAGSLGLSARRWSDDDAQSSGAESTGEGDVPADAASQKDASEWVVLARAEPDLAPIADDERWEALDPTPGDAVWTDDYSNLLGTFLR
jgi:SAM-dependent methyltransferase